MKLNGYEFKWWPVFDIFNWHLGIFRFDPGGRAGMALFYHWSLWIGCLEIRKRRDAALDLEEEEEQETEVAERGGQSDG